MDYEQVVKVKKDAKGSVEACISPHLQQRTPLSLSTLNIGTMANRFLPR